MSSSDPDLWTFDDDGAASRLTPTVTLSNEVIGRLLEADDAVFVARLLVVGHDVVSWEGDVIPFIALDENGVRYMTHVVDAVGAEGLVSAIIAEAGWMMTLNVDAWRDIFAAEHPGVSLDDAFRDRFDRELPLHEVVYERVSNPVKTVHLIADEDGDFKPPTPAQQEMIDALKAKEEEDEPAEPEPDSVTRIEGDHVSIIVANALTTTVQESFEFLVTRSKSKDATATMRVYSVKEFADAGGATLVQQVL